MTKKTVDDDFTENIIDVDVSREMENSFLEYAYSVIYSRALPDARDGLKPYSAASFTPWETWEFALTVPM
ncbi:topoisomerase IV subunit A [Cutibacterium acnes JCM 18918]|nr:topoisomerase IV subunit A [Cutibacterium acnes JCM 18918]